MALNDTLEQNALTKINGKKDRVELVSGGKNVNGKFVANAPVAPLPTPTLTPPSQIDASALSTSSSLKDPKPASTDFADFQTFLSSATPDDSPLVQERTNLSTQIRDRIREIGQKGARQTELEAEAGVVEDQQSLRETNEQIARLKESFDTAIVNEEGVARPQEFITGRQDFLSKKRAVQVDALSSVAAALQGNITLAQASAKDAVDKEFADEEADLEALWFDYNANKDELERSDKKAATQLEQYLGERARLLTEKKDERAGIIALAQQAALDGAPGDVITQITQATIQEEALRLGGRYIGALDRQAKLQSISASRTSQTLALAEAGDPDAIKALGFDPRSVTEEVDPTTRRQLEAEVDGTTELLDLARQYQTLIAENGYTNTIAGDPQVLGQIDALRAQLTASYKKAETLGTLDAGVLTLMSQLLGESPTSGFFDPTKNITGRPAKKLVSSLDTFIETAEKAQARASLRLGINPSVLELLSDDDMAEIDTLLGTSTAEFNPANYY